MPKTFNQLLVILACCCLSSQGGAEEAATLGQCPPENPPVILVASSIDSDDHLVLVSYHSIFIGFSGESYNERLAKKVSLKDVQILTVDGMEISLEAARKRLSERDMPVLATSSKARVSKFYATMFAPETLLFVFPAQAPQWRNIESPGASVRQ